MGDSATSSISVSVKDNVATVVIDNPAQRNALTLAMCLALQEAMPKLDEDPDIKVVVLRGAGSAFCSGVAINELSSVLAEPQDGVAGIDHLSRADMAITSITKPTVALVDGACMGRGWQIASACDFIISSERSTFAITPAKIGIIYPRIGIERLVRLVGHSNAKFILLTGKTCSVELELKRIPVRCGDHDRIMCVFVHGASFPVSEAGPQIKLSGGLGCHVSGGNAFVAGLASYLILKGCG